MRHVVHPPPQTPQVESVAKPGTLLLIILSLICESDIKELYGKFSSSLFKKTVRGQKHLRKVDERGNSIPYINHFKLHH